MVFLHIASIKNRPFCGVDVIVPKHIIEQQKIETVGLINISNVKCLGIEKQYEYDKRFNIIKLPDPFNKPDLVVFHQVYSPEYIFISKQLFKQNIPYIIVPHGSLTVEAQKQKRIK